MRHATMPKAPKVYTCALACVPSDSALTTLEGAAGTVLTFGVLPNLSIPLLYMGHKCAKMRGDLRLLLAMSPCKGVPGSCDVTVGGKSQLTVHCGVALWLPSTAIIAHGLPWARVDRFIDGRVGWILDDLAYGRCYPSEMQTTRDMREAYARHMVEVFKITDRIVVGCRGYYCSFPNVGPHVPAWACVRKRRLSETNKLWTRPYTH